ncbi:Ig-like domain-containing protein [Streptomyces sp. Tu 3180]|uniref:Ig-like domain-containing protein n=1 Tax=Streptomyces sp. Tu 3180 TaxID=2682611 RepID=UPI001359FF92|nr:Ig-like domain-containing protein [Streptomyces sp. Tu 3180]KAF3466474.1 carboxypeptidase regulatory-like domain-containing protein [Streptomyces sp. Tu 3180]
MNRSGKTAAAVLTAAALLAGAWPAAGPYAAADDRAAPAHGAPVLWGEVTIPPGREGTVEVTGLTGPLPGTGSTLTLTAPAGTRVTGAPLDAPGYRGSVAAGGRTAAYTATSAQRPWREGAFPFVLAVPADAVPGTRPDGCVLRLADANGAVRATGGCQVTVGLAEPVLTRPESGVPLGPRPEIAGTAHPGAQVTVSDRDGAEVCTATAGPDGHWDCTPGPALPAGPDRLQATAVLNGVSAVSEQIQITVGGTDPAPRRTPRR